MQSARPRSGRSSCSGSAIGTPGGRGPWQDEPDKLAWRDAATGLDCIILRQASGALGGYVGIDPGHPLHGFHHDAVPPSLGISPHRGLDYSALCSSNDPEEMQVCHVVARLVGGRTHMLEPGQIGDVHHDKWWFGFSCDKPGDLVPDGPVPDRHREEGEVYRAMDYLYHETVGLAHSLAALDRPAAQITSTPQLGAPAPRLGKS